MGIPDGSVVAFPLNRRRHFRGPAALVAAAVLLGGLSWPLDVAASAAGGGRQLTVAVAVNVVFGLAELVAAIAVLRASRTYRAALRHGFPASVLTVARWGVALHLANARLTWREIEDVRIARLPRGGKLLPGPLARRLPYKTRILFGVADPVLGFSRMSGAMKPAARRALFRYRTPYALDPALAAASVGDLTDAITRYAACPVRQVVLSGRDTRPGTAGRLGIVVPELLSRHLSPQQRRSLEHSGLQWALLLIVPFAVGATAWFVSQTFQDAWLMNHGRRTTAVVEAITSSCQGRAPASFRISFTGPGGAPEIADTTDVDGCPSPGTVIQVMYDPAHPGDAGEIAAITTTPFRLLLIAELVTFQGALANMLVQFWRDPVIIRNATRQSYGLLPGR